MVWTKVAIQAFQDTAADIDSGWMNLGATGVIGALLVWIITRAFPAMLERHDTVQTETRNHFERVLNSIDTHRVSAAREGHDAAKLLSQAISSNTEIVRENTRALDQLSQKIK